MPIILNDYTKRPSPVLKTGAVLTCLIGCQMLIGFSISSPYRQLGKVWFDNTPLTTEPTFVGELRRCALQAGLITDIDSTALDFCSEPEASALECVGLIKTMETDSSSMRLPSYSCVPTTSSPSLMREVVPW